MLDKLMEKMIENATSVYLPKVEEKAKARKEKLEQIKSKIRTNPEHVEQWFDKEIGKLLSIDIKQIMKNATAGI
jgi:3-methyladenine DNA glycosylase AlkD